MKLVIHGNYEINYYTKISYYCKCLTLIINFFYFVTS